MGILQGLEEVGWESVPVCVAETVGADSLHQSLVRDELVTLPAITSIAKSLGARTMSRTIFEKCRELGSPKVWVITPSTMLLLALTRAMRYVPGL